MHPSVPPKSQANPPIAAIPRAADSYNRMVQTMSPTNAAITPLIAVDVPRLHALIEVCYAACGMTFSLDDPAEAHLADPVAYFNGNIWCVGPLPGHPGPELTASAALHIAPDASSAEIKSVYVHPGARRQGLGRRMTEYAIAHARAQRVPVITLWSDTRFTAAHALYENMGFVRTGERTCDDFNNSREYGYTLDGQRTAPQSG